MVVKLPRGLITKLAKQKNMTYYKVWKSINIDNDINIINEAIQLVKSEKEKKNLGTKLLIENFGKN